MLKIYQLRLKQNTFEVTLKYKGVGVRVAFVDGNTYNGVPAKCYTNDPFKQRAIENSQMFKDKEIVLERTVEEESDRKGHAAKFVKVSRKAVTGTGSSRQAVNPNPAPKPDPEPALTPDPEKTPETVTDGDGTQAMTFDNLGEAIQYIAREWQIPVQKESEARRVLKEHGINPTIKKG